MAVAPTMLFATTIITILILTEAVRFSHYSATETAFISVPRRSTIQSQRCLDDMPSIIAPSSCTQRQKRPLLLFSPSPIQHESIFKSNSINTQQSIHTRLPSNRNTSLQTTTKNENEPEISLNNSSSSSSNPIQNFLQETSLQSILLLNIVAIIWGTQHAVIKTVVDDCDASAFSFTRFALGAIIASPFTPSFSFLWDGDGGEDMEKKKEEKEEAMIAWRWGLEMGMWMFLGYAFQAIGLAFTTAQRSGFLLYLNVKFVPFFARILLGRNITIPTWISALTALTGTALLSFDGTTVGFNIGDVWSVAAAAASAMFILRLETASSKVADSASLNAACLWTVTTAALIWTFGDGLVASSSSSTTAATMAALPEISTILESTLTKIYNTITSHPLELIYLGGVTTALANYIQTRAQKDVTAERASLIYAMDPVYGAVFANLLLGETLGPLGVGGAGLITVAAATNAFLDLGSKNEDDDDDSKDGGAGGCNDEDDKNFESLKEEDGEKGEIAEASVVGSRVDG